MEIINSGRRLWEAVIDNERSCSEFVSESISPFGVGGECSDCLVDSKSGLGYESLEPVQAAQWG